MLAQFVIVMLMVLQAWLGWRGRVRTGWLAALLLPASIGMVAARAVAVPSEVGSVWVFVLVFAVLAGVSLAALGVACWMRRIVSRRAR